MRLKLGLLAVLAAALAAVGCGGGGGGSSETASGPSVVVPGNAVAYIWSNNNTSSTAWKNAAALLDRFPAKDELIAKFKSSLSEQGVDWDTDLKPALGKESALAWLDFQNDGEDFVAIMKPKDRTRMLDLLSKADPAPVHEDVDGWLVVAKSQTVLDRFDQARAENGSLGDQSEFRDAYDSLSGDALARAWVRGSAVVTALKRQVSGVASTITDNLAGDLDSITAAVTPGTDGVSVTSSFHGLGLGDSTYRAELPGSLPAGALLYFSVHGIGSTLDHFVEKLGSGLPTFDQQKAQIELVLGFPLSDAFDLLDGESAVAIYPSTGGASAVVFAAQVSDESKARTIIDRLTTLAAATGKLHVRTLHVGSVDAHEIELQNGTFAYLALFDGKLIATTSRTLLDKMQSEPHLADDPVYKAAISRAPDETSGFVYGNLHDGLPALFDYLERHGSTIEQDVKDNTAPLQGFLLYGSKDGDTLTFTGFLGIQ